MRDTTTFLKLDVSAASISTQAIIDICGQSTRGRRGEGRSRRLTQSYDAPFPWLTRRSPTPVVLFGLIEERSTGRFLPQRHGNGGREGVGWGRRRRSMWERVTATRKREDGECGGADEGCRWGFIYPRMGVLHWETGEEGLDLRCAGGKPVWKATEANNWCSSKCISGCNIDTMILSMSIYFKNHFIYKSWKMLIMH